MPGLRDEQRAELAAGYFKVVFDDDKGAEAVVFAELLALFRVVREQEQARARDLRNRERRQPAGPIVGSPA